MSAAQLADLARGWVQHAELARLCALNPGLRTFPFGTGAWRSGCPHRRAAHRVPRRKM